MRTTERMKRIRTLTTLVVAAVAAMTLSLLLISAKPSQAEPFSFNENEVFSMHTSNFTSWWSIWNNSGTSNGLPVGGTCTERFNSGLGVISGQLATSETDAFRHGLTVFVDNQQFVSPDIVDRSGTTLTSGPVSLSGLNTSVQYYLSPGTYLSPTDTLRTFISLNNPTTNSITVPVTVATGLNASISYPTGIRTINTSSGDTTFTTSDSYIITDDGSTVGGAPTVTSVVAGGWGSPQAQPSAVSDTVCQGQFGGTRGVLVTYDVTVPAGQTHSVLLFNQLNPTPTEASEEVGVFNDNHTLAETTDFLAGLSTAELATVVNFDLPEPAPEEPPAEIVGGDGGRCTVDSATQTETCVGGGGGHQLGTKYGCGTGQHRVDTLDQMLSFSGGSACGGADVENDSAGGRCVLNSEGTYDCVGKKGF
jgi:hypothetical protein